MTQRSRTYLKAVFETGDIPTGTDYADLIDSFVSLEASASQTMAGALTLPGVTTSTLSVTGPATLSSPVRLSTESINPTGTTQGSAASVSAAVVVASAEQLERSIVLPALQPGRSHHIVNSGTTALAIFPPSGENFVGSAANGGISIAAEQGITIFHVASAYAFVRG